MWTRNRDAWNPLRRAGARFSGRIFLGLLLFLATGVPWAADNLPFGPQSFERGPGKPERIFLTFPADDLQTGHALFLYNGPQEEPEKVAGRVSSAKISLNGELIVGPRDLNRHIGFLKVPVTLESENELSVELRGSPGGYLTLEIGRTDNHRPVADAGPDQTVALGETAWLDGSSSHDLDGDRISYQWRLTGLPELSLTDLSEANALVTSFEVDVPGDYLAELIVHDGERDSDPAQVHISTNNSAPVANAGPDRTMAVGETAVLDGGASYDADGDRLTYSWSLPSIPAQSQASLRYDTTPYPQLDLDLPGDYLVRLIVSDGLYGSDADDMLVSTENSRPVADAGPDQVLELGEAAVLDASGSSDADGDALSYDWALLYTPAGSLAELRTPQSDRSGLIPDLLGDYVAQLVVDDGVLASDPDTVRLTVEAIVNTPPIITSSPDTRAIVGERWQYNLSADDPEGDPLVYALVVAPAGMTIDRSSGGVGWVPETAGDFVVTARVSDGRGGEADQTFTVTVTDSAIGGLPPDPANVAPLLDPTAITPFDIANEFLYTGPDPIQTGVGEGTIEPRRAAVIRGRVLDRAGKPLPGVSLSIKDHPELGQTQSREDGWFDLAVNGGGLLTLDYQKEGYLIAQRQVRPPWQDYAFADEVVLIALDPRVTVINLADTSLGTQVARGSVSEDEDGARQATILFPEGTTAKMVLPDGTEQPLSSLSVRTTEYTVGANGPQTMPAPLPPTSGYTYAVELSVDEAIAHGAKRVELSRPLPIYVDNFIGFPTGEIVPVGWYDFDEATWIPAPNGRVIEILREDNGLAVLAVSGEGLDATPEDLEALGIDEVERQTLAELYEPGTSLWRVLVDHFSPWDCNWPYGPPDDAELPPDRGPKNPDEGSPDRDCEAQGCVIGVESQVLGEDVSIIGTPYSIHYRSDRVLGRKAKNVLKIPLSDSTLPASLKRIELTIQIAGRRVEHSFLPAPDLTYTWTWDGLDAFGRSVTGANTARVEIKYVYGAAYYSAPSDFDASFAHLGASSSATGGQLSIVGQRQALEVGIAKTWSKTLGAFSPDAAGLGAWSLSVHHAYDPVGRILYRGDGRRRSAISIGRVITTPAGNGDSDYLGDAPPYGDGGPAIDAVISPTDVELAPDGSLYIADSNSGRIRRVDLDGVITNVAGTYPGGDYGDGGPATEARLDRPHGIAFGPDGSLYIADTYNNRIRRVGPDGMISTVAGTGDPFYRGDGGPATQTTLDFPRDVAVAPDGSLYIADDYNNRIRRVGTDGIISTVAGGGDARYGDDGGPAIGAYLVGPGGVAVAPDGSLYIAETRGHRIRRVGTDGIITTVAGTHYRGYFGDGGPAIEAGLNHPEGVSVGPDGSVYIADTLNQRIRRVGPDGIIRTLAGTGAFSYNGDERPATGAMLNYPSGVALDFDGNLYVADWFNLRVRRVGAALPGTDNADIFVPSEEGGELYHFDPSGRHLETLDTLTGAVLYSFGYNPGGLLVSITDVDGEVTRIEREPAGDSSAMFAPNGQRTDLTLDPNGYLATVSNPAGDTHRMVYSADGLLTSYADPREQTATYQYDDLGLLTRDDSPNGGGWLLSRTETDDGHSVTLTSKEGRAGTYAVETVGTGGQLRSHTAVDGTVTRSIEQTDGVTLTTRPDGTLISSKEGPDPRFGMQSPVTEEYSLTTPGGLVYSTTESRGVELADERDPLSLTALTETITTNGRESTSRYDAASRTWTHTSPEGRVSTAVVDAKGRLSESRVAALEAAHLVYDARGRLETVIQGEGPEARTTGFGYNAEGYLEMVTDALGHSLVLQYDPAGRVLRQTLPDLREIHYGYDPNGNVVSVIPPGRPAHVFSYNAADLEQQYMPPDLSGIADPATRYEYNRDKQLTRITRPDAQTVDLGYDPTTGQLLTLTIPRGVYRYRYDPTSADLSGIDTPDGNTVSFSYDGLLLTQRDWIGTVYGSVSQSFDKDLNVTSRSVNGANTTSFAYDQDNLLTQAGAMTIERSPEHGLVTGTSLGSTTTARSHNGFGELATYQAEANAESLVQWAYTRDALGRITAKQETVGDLTITYGYQYDAAGRLVEDSTDGVVTETYGYDVNGNRTHVNGIEVGTYDDQDRMTAYGAASYEYTENGELRSKTEAGVSTGYSYDVLGNLTNVALPGDLNIEYVIDGKNRRIGKKVNGVLTQGLLYKDQLNPIAELDGSGNVVARFIYGDKINVPAYMEKGGKTYRIISDHLGSPRLVIDIVDGSIAQRMDYDPWGNVLLDTKPGFQPFGFAGGVYDPHTLLVRLGARDYDARTGRWTDKEPLGFGGGGTNFYQYGLSDPVNLIDIDGRLPVIAWWAVGLGIWSFDVMFGQPDVPFDSGIAVPASFPIGPARMPRILGGCKEVRTTWVIGKQEIISNPKNLFPGEQILPVKVGKVAKSTWMSNSAELRKAMKSGHRIRDVTPKSMTPFLTAERTLLRQHGWKFDGTYWNPPR